MAQWVARLIRNVEVARNFTLIAKYWLVPGTDSSVISHSK